MERIGKYKVVKELGAGGFGAVYLAKDPRLDELVAIKVFHIRDASLAQQATSATSDAGEVLRARFLYEARTLRQLNRNAHIVDVFDFDELEDGRPYYVMPYLPKSLKDELGSDATDAALIAELDAEDRPKRLPIAKALIYLEQCLIALKAVHKAGLVHRDIKPANLLLDEHDEVKLCDFGIAKVPDSDNSQSGIGMGSRNYMAPEQRQSAKHVGASSDIYSVGVLAYRMLTGTLPEGRFADPKDYQPGISEALNEWVLTALAQQKTDRFSDGGVMLSALKQITNTQNIKPEDEYTGTWVEDNTSNIKAELKPLEQKIIALLQSQGEVKDSDMPVLNALADLGGLIHDELAALIQQIAESQSKQSLEQKAFQQWVQTLNTKQANGGRLSDEELSALIAAGITSTGKAKEALGAIIQAKHLSPQAQRQGKTAPDETHIATAKPNKSSSSKKAAIVLGLLIIISTGSYFAYDYYQSEQLRIAQEAEEKTQAEQITQAQSYLIKLDYAVSETGELDTRTQKAVEAFEAKRDLLVTGEVDRVLLNALELAWKESVDAAWQQAKTINSSKSYEDFIVAYANSRYTIQAENAKQIALKREANARASAATRKADITAWEKAKNTNTLSAYQAYLSTQAQGQYRKQAQTRIDAINLENSTVALTINTTPSDATVQVLNIKDTYQDGMRLVPSTYQVKVSRAGYMSQTNDIALSKGQSNFSFTLEADFPLPIQDLVKGLKPIPSGSFMMGCSAGDSDCNNDEKPLHRVSINTFTLMESEVTWAMYQPCIDAGACPNNDSAGVDNGWGKGNRPVIEVSYDDIIKHYIPWLNKITGQTFRLPSEAEWEYAARGGTNTKYSWGNAINCEQARYGRRGNGECSNSLDGTVPVKSFSPNAYGLYDMHGNVWEWTTDCWNDTYAGAPNDGRAWTQGDCSRRVVRGGSWYNFPWFLRASFRNRNAATYRFYNIGFRLAQD